MKAVVATFNQEKTLLGALSVSVIVETSPKIRCELYCCAALTRLASSSRPEGCLYLLPVVSGP